MTPDERRSLSQMVNEHAARGLKKQEEKQKQEDAGWDLKF